MLHNILLIPSYEPTDELLRLCNELSKKHIMIIVNDGTKSPTGIEIFSKLKRHPNITVIHHSSNKGKGAALKTGFAHIHKNHDFNYVITLDADGQHLPMDIERISAVAYNKQTYDLILGTRNFDGAIPRKSRIGNKLTSIIFKSLYRYDLKDTQTGLRAYAKSTLLELLEIPSNKYDFELDALIYAVKKHKKVKCIDISTVYIDNNKGSHFRPIIDSYLIYRTLFGFMLSSFISFLVDYTLFILLFFITQSILLSTFISRLASAYVNFNLNLKLFLNHRGVNFSYALKYIVLAAVIFISSYTGILLLTNLSIGVFTAKIIVDLVLFFSSFFIQKKLFK